MSDGLVTDLYVSTGPNVALTNLSTWIRFDRDGTTPFCVSATAIQMMGGTVCIRVAHAPGQNLVLERMRLLKDESTGTGPVRRPQLWHLGGQRVREL